LTLIAPLSIKSQEAMNTSKQDTTRLVMQMPSGIEIFGISIQTWMKNKKDLQQ